MPMPMPSSVPSSALAPEPATDLPDLPPAPPGRYRHYKGRLYQVIGSARHSETLAPLVVYRPLYGEGALWVRPHAMFFEAVQVNGHSVPRFERLTDEPASGTDPAPDPTA
jgi:hypothetical protein